MVRFLIDISTMLWNILEWNQNIFMIYVINLDHHIYGGKDTEGKWKLRHNVAKTGLDYTI